MQHGNADATKTIILRSGGVAAFRQKYDVGWFCEKLEKTYKVAATREAFEKAKRPGTTQVRHITIKEKGVNPSLSGASGGPSSYRASARLGTTCSGVS